MAAIGYVLRYGYVIGAVLLAIAVAAVAVRACTYREVMRGASARFIGRLLRYGYALGAVLLVSASAAVTFHAYVYHEIFKVPAPPNFPRPRDKAQAQRQDLAYLESTLMSLDRSFSPIKRREFNKAIATIARSAGSMSPAEFEVRISHAVALDQNGHTNLQGFAYGLSLNSLPIRFAWFPEGLYVIEALPEDAELLGARVCAEGGHAPATLADALREYVGGRPTLAAQLSPNFLESPAALNAAGLVPSSSEVSFEFELPGGRIENRVLQAMAVPVNGRAPPDRGSFRYRFWANHWPRRNLSPVAFPGEHRPWEHVLGGLSKLPLSLQNPNLLYWETYLHGHEILYIQLNAVASQPGRLSLPRFLEQVVKTAIVSKPRYAIVDLRSNSGGDYELTTVFTRKLPRLIPKNGTLFVLTSGNTFSAAIVMTAQLKYFGGSRAIIVGQPQGDYEQFWAEGSTRIFLRNSHLTVGYATGYHDWAQGCTLLQILICAPENYSYGVAAGSLQPKISVQWSYKDYISGRDTVMDTIMSVIERQMQSSLTRQETLTQP